MSHTLAGQGAFTGQTATRRGAGLSVLLFLLLLLMPLPFMPEYGGANSMTRLMLTSAIVDEGGVRIDRHADLTVDKASFEGHAYADKAPGMSFLAIPAYAAGKAVAEAAGFRLDLFPRDKQTTGEMAARLLVYRAIVLTTGGLLMALAGLAFFHLARRLTGDDRASLVATLIAFLGTPFLGWSVQFFGHAAAGSSLVIGFAMAQGLGGGLPRPALRAVLGGLALGLAVVIEYTAAPAAALVGLYALWQLRRFSLPAALGYLGLALLGVVAAIIPLLVYNTVAFGGPLTVGYAEVQGFEGMQEGFMGITVPDPKVLVRITFGLRRGLLPLAPVLILWPIGFWLGWRRQRPVRPELLLCMAVTVYYFLLNSSYHYWGGGASMGPRHVVPSIPFMGLCLAWIWALGGGGLRTALLVLGGLGLVFSAATAAVTMVPVGGYEFPLLDPTLTHLFGYWSGFARYGRLGIPPLTLFAVWIVVAGGLGAALWRGTRPG